MKLVTIFLLIVTAIHVHLYQQFTGKSLDSIREVKTILDRDLPNTMFVKREEFLNMNAIEIYLNHTLNILKDHASK